MPFGQSAIIGLLAGELSGAACDAFGAEKDVKRIVQAGSCLLAGEVCAATADLPGAGLVLGETLMYATGNSPATVVNALTTLFGGFAPPQLGSGDTGSY